MKCLLVLLAFELVSSEKLDRTYLPPPGAKHAGGTLDDLHLPLEYIQENKQGPGQNGLAPNNIQGRTGNNLNPDVKNTFQGLAIDYTSLPKYDGYFRPTSSFLADTRQTNLEPAFGINNYKNFPSTFPSASYLPSKQTFGTDSFNESPYTPFYTTNLKNSVNPGNKKINPGLGGNDNENYYFLPATQTNSNGMAIPRPDSIKSENFAMIQYPNENSKALNTISENYQPNVFGLYGGSPMIMRSQNFNDNNMKLIPKFGEKFENEPMTTGTAKSYQTPLPGLTSTFEEDTKNTSNNPSISVVIPTSKNQQTQFKLPTATIRSFPQEDTSFVSDQRNKIISRPRYRPQRPQTESDRNAFIVNYDNNITPDGYSYSYDTSNGIHANETATTTNGVRAKGFYSYTGDDGKVYTVTYTADENGFRPQGDHLPTSPPVPEAIKRVIEQAERDKAAGIIDDGSYDEKKYGYLKYENGINKYLPIKKSERNSFKNNSRRRPINRKSMVEGVNSFVSKSSDNYNENQFNDRSYDKNKNMAETIPVNTRNRSGLKQTEQEKDQMIFRNRQPITSVNDDQFTTKKSSSDQNINLPNTVNPYDIITKTPAKSQQGIIGNEGSKIPFNDTGYYYVPPQNRFNPKIENPFIRKTSYTAAPDAVPNNDVKMRNGFDTKQKKNESNKVNTKSLPTIKNRDGTTTRKPYISGPEIQESVSTSNALKDSPIYNANPSEISSYPIDQSILQYFPNTTPMTAQTIVTNQPSEDYPPQYYKSNTNPDLFYQTLPGSVENRVNVPPRKPDITVSQDFTTTIRPGTFKNGVLEVKQNVKIFGIGKPEKSNTISESNLGYDNDVLNLTSTPNLETFVTGGSSTIYPGLVDVQNTGLSQEIPNSNNLYGNVKTEEVNLNNAYIPETYDSSNSQNSYPRSDIETQGYPNLIPAIPFPISPFESGINIPGQDLLNIATNNPNLPGNPFGENFSGPKQVQKFDSVNGYYY